MNEKLKLYLKLEPMDEGFTDIFDKIKRLFSNFILQKRGNKELVVSATKDEVEGLYIELEKMMTQEKFKEVKPDVTTTKFSFLRDTEIVNVSNPHKDNYHQYTFTIAFN